LPSRIRIVRAYQNIRSASFSFITIHASDRQAHGQTDRIATAIPCVALHAVARYKSSQLNELMDPEWNVTLPDPDSPVAAEEKLQPAADAAQ